MSSGAVLSAGLGLLLAGWAVWIRIPAAIYAVYLGALVALIFVWGLGLERSFGRVVAGASLGAVSATALAFIGMLLPNEEQARRCAQPGVYCEDFSGALLLYGAPFVLMGVPLLAGVVRAACVGIGHLARRATRAGPSRR